MGVFVSGNNEVSFDDDDVVFVVVSTFCNRSYNGASLLFVNEEVCGVRINERNNVD